MNIEKSKGGGKPPITEQVAQPESISEKEQPQEIMEVLREVKAQEKELPTAEKGPKSNRLKQAFVAVTVGLTIFGVSPDFARAKEQPTERQKIEMQMQELQNKLDNMRQQESREKEAERKKEVQGWLNTYFDLGVFDIGEAKARVRCPCEQYGIYLLNGEHLGDIRSDGFSFSKNDFVRDVSKLLKQKGIDGDKINQNLKKQGDPSYLPKLEANEISKEFSVDIDSSAQKILQEWGGGLEDGVFNTGKEKMNFDNNTESVKLTGINDNIIIMTIFDKKDQGGKTWVCTYIDQKLVNVKEYTPK